jgi:maltose-binding protein MalE
MGTDGKLSFTTDIDSEEAVEQSAYINQLLTTYIKNGTLNIGQAMGGESNSVYTLNGAWSYTDPENGTGYYDILGENLTLTTTPSFTVNNRTVQMKSFLGSKLLGVNAAHDADKVAVGHELAKLLISEEGALRRYEARQSIPTNTAALENARFADNTSATVVAIQNQSALGGFSQAATVQGGDLWDIFENALGKGLAGNGSENDPDTGLIADWAAYLATQASRIRALSV